MLDIKIIRENLSKTGVLLKDEGLNMIQDFIRNERREAKEEQRRMDIVQFVTIMADNKKKDDEIYEMLSKYWEIDSRKDARQIIVEGKYINWPLDRLRANLKENGYSNIEIIRYMKDYDVRNKLENNSKLCEMPIEKMKLELQK